MLLVGGRLAGTDDDQDQALPVAHTHTTPVHHVLDFVVVLSSVLDHGITALTIITDKRLWLWMVNDALRH